MARTTVSTGMARRGAPSIMRPRAAAMEPYRASASEGMASNGERPRVAFSQIGVATTPGSTTLTWIPCGSSSIRSASLKPSTACLEAQ